MYQDNEAREHQFMQEYVDNVKRTPQIQEMIRFCKRTRRHTLASKLYALFFKLAKDAYGIHRLSMTDEEIDERVERIISEDGTLDVVASLMESN